MGDWRIERERVSLGRACHRAPSKELAIAELCSSSQSPCTHTLIKEEVDSVLLRRAGESEQTG